MWLSFVFRGVWLSIGALGALEAGVKERGQILEVTSKMKVPIRKTKSFDLNRSLSFGSAASSSASPPPLALCDLTSPGDPSSRALVPLNQPSIEEVTTTVEDVEGSLRILRDMRARSSLSISLRSEPAERRSPCPRCACSRRSRGNSN